MADLGPYGSYAASFGGATSGYGAPANPFQHPERQPGGAFDANLYDANEGIGALGFYATQPGVNAPFSAWLTNTGTHRQLWDDYVGQAASKNDPTFSFSSYLAQNDPYTRYANLSPTDRGDANPSSISPYAILQNLG